jgi:hypothetical protein
MTSRHALGLFAATIAAWAFVDGAFALAGHAMPASLPTAFCAAAGASLVLWYRQDSREHARPASWWFALAILPLWVLAVPAYLWRSRKGGDKWRMVLVAIGVGASIWLAFLLANLPAAVMSGR